MHEAQVMTELDEPTLSVAEFARACGVHRVTASRWVKGGLVRHLRTPTGRIKIPVSAVAESVTVHNRITDSSPVAA